MAARDEGRAVEDEGKEGAVMISEELRIQQGRNVLRYELERLSIEASPEQIEMYAPQITNAEKLKRAIDEIKREAEASDWSI